MNQENEMNGRLHIREITESDSQAIARLSSSILEEGHVPTSPIYQMDAFQAITVMHHDIRGFIAIDNEDNNCVGLGFVKFGRCLYEGDLIPFAYLNSLMVHPEYRRQGIAGDLVKYRINQSMDFLGERGVLVANIKNSNPGSMETASRWCKQLFGPIYQVQMKVSSDPPKPPSGYTIRPALAGEYHEIAQGINRFYQDHNFHIPADPNILRETIATTPFDRPFRHYWVVVDGQGTIQAGTEIFEQYRIRVSKVARISFWQNIKNKISPTIPEDGVIRELILNRLWVNPEHEKAAQYLIDDIRWEWRERATHINLSVDKRSEIGKILRFPSLSPKININIAVSASKRMVSGRPVIPIF